MLTDLSTDTFFKFTEGKGHVIGDQTVVPDGVVSIYLSTAMSHIEETTDSVSVDIVQLGNIVNRFVTKDEFQIPTTIKFKNAITATISENRVIALANEQAEQKYRNSENPSPLYYLKRSAKIPAGTEVTVKSNIGSIKDMYIN